MPYHFMKYPVHEKLAPNPSSICFARKPLLPLLGISRRNSYNLNNL